MVVPAVHTATLIAAAIGLNSAIALAANPGSLRVLVAPGAGTLSQQPLPRAWAPLASLSVGVSLSRQLWVEGFIEQEVFRGEELFLDGDLRGLTLNYSIDVLDVAPYAEAGMARVRLTPRSAADPPLREVVPILGVGVDSSWARWFVIGIGIRYFPVLQSDLTGNPAQATLHARFGVVLDTLDIIAGKIPLP